MLYLYKDRINQIGKNYTSITAVNISDGLKDQHKKEKKQKGPKKFKKKDDCT